MNKKTVLITGATSGIGLSTARAFAKEAYRLVLCGRRQERLDELKAELGKQTEVYTLNFDVR
ncbi:MAG: SDR family NAD(P)-dependent oxidoreductase, partial [Eudoraea sp.]|nr:SDR family NAD(P)-dependent oxidoreductase [Eudoraea sp.]